MARTIRVLTIAVLLVTAKPTMGMECGGRLIEVGDSEAQVVNLCGEPTRREVRNRGLSQDYGGLDWQSPETEEWTYAPGAGQFVRHLRFENGTLEQIRAGGYADLE